MALPFHVSCSQHGVGLYELADGRFQFIEDGPIAPLMVGPGYMLVERALAVYLQSLQLSGVSFAPAVIWHRRADKEFRTHERMVVEQRFLFGQANHLDLDGDRLLNMNDQNLFASPSLAQRLRESPFTYLRLTEGWADFAANAS